MDRKKTSFVLCLIAAMIMLASGVSAAAKINTDPKQQLPDPDGKPADMTKPVQVFILMGQSNMVGAGKVQGDKEGSLTYAVQKKNKYPYLGDKEGSLTYAVQKKNKYPYLVDDEGNWTERKDVRYVRVMGSGTGKARQFNNEWMTVKGGRIGPELGIGHVMGHVIDAPVMSQRYEVEEKDRKTGETKTFVYAGYKDSPAKWEKGTEPKKIGWYAGMQYDGDVANAKKVLAELDKYYPGAKGYEVAGFFFWQGDKDRYNAAHADRYEQNLVRFIKQLRKDFNAPKARFVCATLGQTRKGALAVDGKTGKYPEFKGNVACVYSNPFCHGGASNSHYGGNAETYMDVGQAMGWAMAELLVNQDK